MCEACEKKIAAVLGFEGAALETIMNGIRAELADQCPESGEPIEKLTAAALEHRVAGSYPYYIYIAIAALLAAEGKLRPDDDLSTRKAAIREATGCTGADVIYGIVRGGERLAKGICEDAERVELLKRAFNLGFYTEKQYRGCAQGTLKALFDLTGVKNDELYRAATGFSGGMAICGDGACGGYSGGLLFMSMLRGRSLDRIAIDGDKENQYFAYDCAQLLHDRYIECYEGVVCGVVHEHMFDGERYILRTKSRRDEFEEAGAHTVVCTTVVGLACMWCAEIMLDMGFWPGKQ